MSERDLLLAMARLQLAEYAVKNETFVMGSDREQMEHLERLSEEVREAATNLRRMYNKATIPLTAKEKIEALGLKR